MKKTNILKSIQYGALMGLFYAFLLLPWSACYEPEEGCLDNNATNYDVSADDLCGTCCTYPQLIFQVSHFFGDTSLLFDSIYTLSGSPVRFVKFRFYLSELQLQNSQESIGVTDSIALIIPDAFPDSNQTVEDNFSLIAPGTFSYSIGEFRSTATFDSTTFLIGLAPPASQTDPSRITSTNHPLGTQSDTMYREPDGYIFNKMHFQRDTAVADTTELELTGASNLVRIALPFNQAIELGEDVVVKVLIDYSKWLKGIDFVADTEEDMLEKIVNNTPEVFSVIE